jgi:dihydroneopterin aldolase
MRGTIGFNQHKIQCIIGVLPFERQDKQEILVDLKVVADFSRCAKTDSLDDTINYVAMAELCTRLAQSNHYQLLETFACEVLQKLFDQFPIQWAWIRIQKMAALSSGYAYVELESLGDRG